MCIIFVFIYIYLNPPKVLTFPYMQKKRQCTLLRKFDGNRFEQAVSVWGTWMHMNTVCNLHGPSYLIPFQVIAVGRHVTASLPLL